MRQNAQVECVCGHCGKPFKVRAYRVKQGNGKFCSNACYLSSRWGSSQPCHVCGKEAKNKYCSPACRDKYWNGAGDKKNRHPRNWARKLSLIADLGGKCSVCGESDHRVLDIDHIDPSQKVRGKSGRGSWGYRFRDWKANTGNLRLLCANCHRRHTWEQMGYGT